MRISRRSLFGLVAAAVVAPRAHVSTHRATLVRTGLPPVTWRPLLRGCRQPGKLEAFHAAGVEYFSTMGSQQKVPLIVELLSKEQELLEGLEWTEGGQRGGVL